jgi:radical SAM protein with 4Fe4S-binding SPASM domain
LPINTPFTVIVDASESCNFRCNYCFRSDDNKEHWGYAKDIQIMKWDVFTKIIEQIQEFPQEPKVVSLSHQGEPLVNRNLPNMVRYIKNKGIKSRVSIHTNAALLDKEYVDDLADSEIDRVVISVQGMTSEKYSEICGVKIDFEKFYDNLRRFYERKKNTQIHIKIANTALNSGEEELFYKKFQPISDRVFIEQIIPLWVDVDVKNANMQVQNKYGQKFQKQECCPLIFHTIVVLPNGDVYPCTQLLTSYVLGNTNEQRLVDLWNSDIRKELLVRQCKKDNPDICRDCFILQNTIYAKEDMIDEYCNEILMRLEMGYN